MVEPDPDPVPGAGAAAPNIARQGVRSFMWAGLSFGGNRLVVFGSTLVLARLLTPRDFGVVAAGLTVITFLELGLDLGVTSALIYEQEEGITPRVHVAFTVNLIVCLGLACVGLAAAPLIGRFFGLHGQDNLFRVLCLYLVIRGVGQVNDSLLQRDLRFKARTAVDLVRAGLRASVSIALAKAGHGPWAIVWGFLAGDLAGTVVAWSIVRFRPRLRLDRDVVKGLLRFGVAVTLLNVVDEIGLNSDYLVVGNRSGATQLGFYTMAFRLPELLIANVFWVFATVAFPVYARSRREGKDDFRATMLRALRVTTLFGFPVATGLAIVSRDAVYVLFSARWEPAIVPMTLLSLAMGVKSIGYASGNIFPALGRPGTLLAINAPLTVLLVVGFVAAAPHGLAAVALVHLLCTCCYAVVRLGVANRLVGASTRDIITALRPAVCVAAGIAVAALPVRLLTHHGPAALAATIVAGVLGALAGARAAGPGATAELRALATHLRPG